MINLLMVIGAIIVAFRMVFPLRIAIRLVAKLVGFVFFIAVAILVVIALLTHGALI